MAKINNGSLIRTCSFSVFPIALYHLYKVNVATCKACKLAKIFVVIFASIAPWIKEIKANETSPL